MPPLCSWGKLLADLRAAELAEAAASIDCALLDRPCARGAQPRAASSSSPGAAVLPVSESRRADDGDANRLLGAVGDVASLPSYIAGLWVPLRPPLSEMTAFTAASSSGASLPTRGSRSGAPGLACSHSGAYLDKVKPAHVRRGDHAPPPTKLWAGMLRWRAGLTSTARGTA